MLNFIIRYFLFQTQAHIEQTINERANRVGYSSAQRLGNMTLDWFCHVGDYMFIKRNRHQPMLKSLS